MDHLKCYTLEETINHETAVTRSQPEGYYKLMENLKRVSNLISNFNCSLKLEIRLLTLFRFSINL